VSVVVAVVGDLHIGSTVGLCPRRVALDDGGAYEASKSQRWLWRCWEDYWRQVAERKADGAQVVVVLNGDLCDRNVHSHYQLWTINRATLQAAVLAALAPVLPIADYVVVVRGTEAHTGQSAEMEEWLARDIDAVPDEQAGSASWWYWEATIAGHNLALAHHPGTNSTRPWTQGGGGPVTRGVIQTNRQAVYLPDADIVVNGHTHDGWYVPIARERLTNMGRITRDIVHFVRTPGYKDEYNDGSSGYHIEKWGPPKPLGAAWLRFWFDAATSRIEIEVISVVT